MLRQNVKSDGIINLFNSAYLNEISQMPQKNLSIEILKKLIAEQVHLYQKTNLVKTQKFSDLLNRAMNSYLNGMLTNEEVIDELMKMAQDMATASKEGNDLGLSDEEMAFYDALTKPEAVKDFYSNEQLVAMTKELTEQLRKSRTVDWNAAYGKAASSQVSLSARGNGRCTEDRSSTV